MIDWAPLVEFLRRHQTVLLVTHVRPDADGLGSQLALADALTALGKTPRVVTPSRLPPRYQFLDPDRNVIEPFRPPGDEFRRSEEHTSELQYGYTPYAASGLEKKKTSS